MKHQAQWFKDPLFRNAYLGLVASFLAVVASLVLLTLWYLNSIQNEPQPKNVAYQAVLLVDEAVLQEENIPMRNQKVTLPDFQIVKGIASKAMPGGPMYNTQQMDAIHQYVQRHWNHFTLSVLLPSGKWLTLSRNVSGVAFFNIGFWVIASCLLIGWLLIAAFLTKNRLEGLSKNHAKMIASISHDLKTPLTRMKLRLEMLPKSDALERFSKDVEIMEQMVLSLLNYLQENRHEEPLQKIEVYALVESICADLIDVGRAVEFQAEATDPAIVSGQMVALKRAISNIIDNALKYGKHAMVRMKLAKDKVIIEVEDQGPGIADDQLQHVFEPFYRVDEARSLNQPGSGLGLTIAREIIERHHGKIVLENRQEGGLRVRVTLVAVENKNAHEST